MEGEELEIFGIRFVGINSENVQKLILTLLLIGVIIAVRFLLGALAQWTLKRHPDERVRFWTWQVISLLAAAALVLGVLSIWFQDSGRLTTAVGLVTAGLAFALQKVITSFAAYFVILRGRNFTVGDRIVMGGVRGDVIALGFIQTTIMEMGQEPSEQPDAPAVWVKSRQYTGRIVTITNDKIFEKPIYNYSRDFPFLWEEITIPVSFKDDRHRAEQILLEVAERHTEKISELGEEALAKMRRHYYTLTADFQPKVYFRLTDNWLEMTVRFLVRVTGTRDMKDAMSRDIITAFDEAGIGIASGTYDIVGFPPIKFENGIQVVQKQEE